MIEQAELNRAFFARYGVPSRAELFGRHGEPSRAELFFAKARAKTEPSRAELRLRPNTSKSVIPRLLLLSVVAMHVRGLVYFMFAEFLGPNIVLAPTYKT